MRLTQSAAAQAPETLIVVGEAPQLIPAGDYDAIGGVAARFRLQGALKLEVPWTVLVPDSETPNGHREVRLLRYYNVEEAPGRRLRAAQHGDLFRELTLVLGRRLTRRERFSLSAFQGVLCRVLVATVTQDTRQRPLPEHARYSKVARLLERKAGGSPALTS